MQNTFPIPVNTPFVDSSNSSLFSYSWTQFFKMVGDEVVTQNMLKNLTGNVNFKYVLNGMVCICNYYSPTPATTNTEITLPYTSQCAFECLGVVYPPLTIKINIPAGTQFTQFMYLVKYI